MSTEPNQLESAARSETGHVRSQNEDAYLSLQQRGLFAVADGMGGHPAGDVASAIAVDILDTELTRERLDDDLQVLPEALRTANDAILADAAEHPSRRGMGTTAVVAHIDPERDRAAVTHAGDSRAYLSRGGELTRLTEDHVSQGLLGRALVQVLGSDRELDPGMAEVGLNPGDRLLLCTDGLTDMVEDAEIARVLSTADHPGTACDELTAAALAAGGVDNVTVIVVDLTDA